MPNGAESISYKNPVIIQEWLTNEGYEVIKRLFTAGNTTSIVTRYDGVEDNLDLATLDITKKLIRGWKSEFNNEGAEFSVGKLRISTAQFKTELSAILNEKTWRAYKAYLRGAGMTMDDMHFVDYLTQEAVPQMQEELEEAIWMGEADDAAEEDAPILERMDGYLAIAKKLHAQQKATKVLTDVSITDANCMAMTEKVFREGLHKSMKIGGAVGFCSMDYFEKFKTNYREKYKNDVAMTKYENTGFDAIKMYVGGAASFLMPREGITNDNALIVSRPKWLAFGYNTTSGTDGWEVQKQDYKTKMMTVFPVGVQILQQRENFLVINDHV